MDTCFECCVIIFRQLENVRVQLQLQLHFCTVRLRSQSSVFMIYMSLSNVKTNTVYGKCFVIA